MRGGKLMQQYSDLIFFIAVTYMFSLKDETAKEVRNRFAGTSVIFIIIMIIVRQIIK